MSSISPTIRKEFEELMMMGNEVQRLHEKLERMQDMNGGEACTILNIVQTNGITCSGYTVSRGTQTIPSTLAGNSVATQTKDFAEKGPQVGVSVSSDKSPSKAPPASALPTSTTPISPNPSYPMPVSSVPRPPPLPVTPSTDIPIPPPLPLQASNIPIPPPLPMEASNIPIPPPLPMQVSNIPIPPPLPMEASNVPIPPPLPMEASNIPIPPPLPMQASNIPIPPPLPMEASHIPIPPPLPIQGSNIPIPPPLPIQVSSIPTPPPLPTQASNIPVPIPPPMPTTTSNIPIPPPLPMQASNIPIPPPMLATTPNIPIPPPLPLQASNIPIPPPLPMQACNVPAPPPLPSPTNSGVPPAPPLPMSTPPAPPMPPPPPMPGTPAPPPPPFPMATPPPPPLPMTPGMPRPPPPPMTPMSGVPPPPPFGTPISGPNTLGQRATGPAPFPAPPIGGWNAGRSAFRKPPVTLSVSMKPLFWTRIVSPSNTTPPPQCNGLQTDPSKNQEAVWDVLEETKIEDIDEFFKLFSRVPVQKKPKEIKKTAVVPKVQAAKILDSKRFQSVGILASSLHLEFSVIEEAVYGFDTTYVSLEALQRIYEVRATPEELTLIKDHVKEKPEIPLDKPERFLYQLSQISFFGERVACLVFQNEFEQALSSIQSKLCILRTVCQELMTSSSLKIVLSVILTLGNVMNGGNMTRGQADGFCLDILPKLRDVKSSDFTVTLLHFVVREAMKKTTKPGKDNLPVPEPDDIAKAGQVLFDDLVVDTENIQKDLKGCNDRSAKVISESPEQHLEPFKSRMDAFLESAHRLVEELVGSLEESKELFLRTIRFYQFQCKGKSKLTDVTPSDFFSLWLPFCTDFKNIWLQESEVMAKKKLKEAREKYAKQVETKKAGNTGLKKLMAKKKLRNGI